MQPIFIELSDLLQGTGKTNNDKEQRQMLSTVLEDKLAEYTKHNKAICHNIQSVYAYNTRCILLQTFLSQQSHKKPRTLPVPRKPSKRRTLPKPPDADKLFLQGMQHFEGNDVPIDFSKAFKLFQRAASLHHVEAQQYSGYCYFKGLGVVKNSTLAVEWFEKAAANNDPTALNNLGYCYHNMIGVPVDYDKAVKLYQRAIAQGDKCTYKNLGICYEQGQGLPKNLRKAYECYLLAAEENVPEAQYRLACCFEMGIGTAINKQKAIEWHKKAAANLYSKSLYQLGVWCQYGQGMMVNYKLAMDYYQEAIKQGCEQSKDKYKELEVFCKQKNKADAGNPLMQKIIGKYYELGMYYPKDIVKAFTWYQKSAAQNHPGGLFCLARCYENGLGVQQSKQRAYELYKDAALYGNSKAREHLEAEFKNYDEKSASGKSNLFSNLNIRREREICTAENVIAIPESTGRTRSYSKEKSKIKKHEFRKKRPSFSKTETFKPAQHFNEGTKYYHGIGVLQDYKKAVECFKQAAKLGHKDASFMLGLCYAQAKGVKKDLQQAVSYYHSAAAMDQSDAQLHLARFFYHGIGLKQDKKLAVEWFKKTTMHNNIKAKFHSTEAQFHLAMLYYEGKVIPKNNTEAAKWFEQPAREDNGKAQYLLGLLLSEGDGVEQNLVEAAKLLQQASDNGNENAEIKLADCYRKGIGVEKDAKKAIEIYRKHAHKNKIAHRPKFQIDPITAIKKFSEAINMAIFEDVVASKKTKSKLPRFFQKDKGYKEANEILQKIQGWYEHIQKEIHNKHDRLAQYKIFYEEISKFIKLAARLYVPGHSLKKIATNSPPWFFNLFNMCMRDFAFISNDNAAEMSLSEIANKLSSNISYKSSSKLLPLQCLPANQFKKDASEITKILYLVQNNPTASNEGLLDINEIEKVVNNSHCKIDHSGKIAPCQNCDTGHLCCRSTTAVSSWRPRAILLNNPGVRDRVIAYLHTNLQCGRTMPPLTTPLLNHFNSLNLFADESPFVLMQQFILYLESWVIKLGGPDASILGEFKPVENNQQFALPIFIAPDGNLLAFLWHGTDHQNTRKIADHSFLKSMAHVGLYGKGIYTAIQSCKSLQYTGKVNQAGTRGSSYEKFCLLLNAVFLGKNPDFPKNSASPDSASSTIAVPNYSRNKGQCHWEFIVRNEAQIAPLSVITYFHPKHQGPQPRITRKLQQCPVQ